MSDSSNASGKATSMADLMSRHASAFTVLKKGESVKATVARVSAQEMYLLLDGTNTEVLAVEKDKHLLKQQLSRLRIGDKVEAKVLSLENELGMPVVSLRHFLENKMWKDVEELQKSQEKLQITVKEATKGGYLVDSADGMSGFLPNSHVAMGMDAQKLVGKTIAASIVDTNREQRKIIFSQKGILSTDDFKKATAGLKPGMKVQGIVSGITTFGLFVSLPKSDDANSYLDGLVHISEVSWEKVDNLSELYTIGESVEAVVVGTDADAKRIDLSFKRLSKDPFGQIEAAYPVDKKASGEVTEVAEAGITVKLPDVEGVSVEGFIKREKLSPNAKYEVGQKVNVTVSQIDTRRRKILLTPVLLEKPLMYR